MNIKEVVDFLSPLVNSLKKTKSAREKKELLLLYADQKGDFELDLEKVPPKDKIHYEIAFYSMVAIEQASEVFFEKKISLLLLSQLVEIDRFYESIGGIVGYHVTFLRKIIDKNSYAKPRAFKRASGMDLSKKTTRVKKATLEGLTLLPKLAEIYPIAGLGARLNLRSEEGEALPVACLPFLGRTLLEGLIRDLEAREYLYYKLFSKRVCVPIAMMTSKEEKNHDHIVALLEKKKWFHRPVDTFFLFPQLSVPVISEEGKWLMKSRSQLLLHPGGHGALWRMAEEKGVFRWLKGHHRTSILIRQINNPIAGIDHLLLAHTGEGKLEHKAFGFASCERLANAAEGVLGLLEKEDGTVTLSNIEYTDFQKYGLEDRGDEHGYSEYPSNTNILFVDLEKVLRVIHENPLPGLVLNMKSHISAVEKNGDEITARAGRLESMMQNLSDAFVSKLAEHSDSYITYHERRKTISVTKKSFDGTKLTETPEGAFYDLMWNAHSLLSDECQFELAPFSTEKEYLKEGPSLIFLYHPALGPLYEVIRAKLRKGKIEKGGELQIEAAEVDIENLYLKGSLLIHALSPLGQLSQGSLRFSENVGRVTLKDVRFENEGIDRTIETVFWKNAPHRREVAQIILHEASEFVAEGVTFRGNLHIVVPPGERWTAWEEEGRIVIDKEKLKEPSWNWKYRLSQDEVVLSKNVRTPSLQEKLSPPRRR